MCTAHAVLAPQSVVCMRQQFACSWPVHLPDVRGGQAACIPDNSGGQGAVIFKPSVCQWPGAATRRRQQGCGYELSARVRLGCRADLSGCPAAGAAYKASACACRTLDTPGQQDDEQSVRAWNGRWLCAQLSAAGFA